MSYPISRRIKRSFVRWKKNEDQHVQKEIRNQQIGDLYKQHMIRYGYQKIATINTRFCNKSVQHFMQKYGWKRRVKVKKTETYWARRIRRTKFNVT